MSFIRKIIALFFLLACFQVVVMQVLPHHHHHHMICVLSDFEEEDHHDAAHQEESEADDDCCITKLQAVVDKLHNTDSSYNLLSFLTPTECVVSHPVVGNRSHKYFDFNNVDCCKPPISPSVGRAPPQYS